MSPWAVYKPLSAKQEHIRRSCTSPARYSCISTAIENIAKAFLGQTAVSTRAVYRPRKLYINSSQKRKRKHFWSTQPCRPGRCLNREQQSKSISGAAVCHQRTLSTAIKAKSCLTHTLSTTIKGKSCLTQRYVHRPAIACLAQPCRPER